MAYKPKDPSGLELDDIAVGKKCFVIMPYGLKDDPSCVPIDFEELYDEFIEPIVTGMKMRCVRCDREYLSGPIHERMFGHIYDADVAIVDITTLNQNVFYELGVRHALADSVTVILKRKGTQIPFNINGVSVLEYQDKNDDTARKSIVKTVLNGLWYGTTDSQVRSTLESKMRRPELIEKNETFRYRVKSNEGESGSKSRPKEICLITGDLRQVRGIDIWVSSENTHMEMARFLERSISSVIRYAGAKLDSSKNVVDDVIANELRQKVGRFTVPAGEIIATGPGELRAKNDVKLIFHAAAVTGHVGKGFQPIEDIGDCVRNALGMAGDKEFSALDLKSILFPLFGTGTAKGDVRVKAEELIAAAIGWLQSNPACFLERVCFLTWSESDLDICQRILRHAGEVEEITAHSAVLGGNP